MQSPPTHARNAEQKLGKLEIKGSHVTHVHFLDQLQTAGPVHIEQHTGWKETIMLHESTKARRRRMPWSAVNILVSNIFRQQDSWALGGASR